MTHMVEKAPVPAMSSSSSSALEGPNIGGSSQSNDIKEEASAAPAALLKQDKGWKVEEKGWKGVPNKTPAKNQTKYKEEYGYIVTNKRYNHCHMCSAAKCLSNLLHISHSSIHPILLNGIRTLHIGWTICLCLWGFFYVFCCACVLYVACQCVYLQSPISV